jgi:hypothetical protein
MNIYCLDKKVEEDGTIIYKKENMILEDYDIIQKNDNIIFKPKIKTIQVTNIDNLIKYNFTCSYIIDCYINNKRPTKNKYMAILTDIYKLIDDGTSIIKNTLLNIKTKNIVDKGFYYNSELGISIQRTDACKTFKEIVNQCLINKFTLNIQIKLSNDKNVIFII